MITLPEKLRNITAKYQKQIELLRGMKEKGFMTPSACEIAVDRLKTLAEIEKEDILRGR